MRVISRILRLAAAVAMVAGPVALSAQGNAVLTGRVTATDGGTVTGGIQIIELQASASIGDNGRYTLTIPGPRVRGQSVTLVARAIGYKPGRRTITLNSGSQTIDFTLEKDVTRLSELVVTGVSGATEQRKLAISVASVTEKDMPVAGANVLNQLQGKVPGAQIVSASGRPGAQPAVLLRGPTQINGEGRAQGPLYVVDGVILNGPLPDINPLDIERVEVVRGAAGASLYGARAGNGVIQITTKSGKTGSDGVRFTVRAEGGLSDIERDFALAQRTAMQRSDNGLFCQQLGDVGGWTAAQATAQCLRGVNLYAEALRVNEGGLDFTLPAVNLTGDFSIARAPTANSQLKGFFQANPFAQRYDAMAAALTASAFTNLNVDAAGKSGNTKYFASVSSFQQQGAIRFLQGYRRQTLRLNVDQALGDWTLNLRTTYARTKQDGLNQSGGEVLGNPSGFFQLTRVPAYADLLRTDRFGRLFVRSNVAANGAGNPNPLYAFQNQVRTDDADRFLGGITARYAPVSWFDLEGNFSYDANNGGYQSIQDRGFRTVNATPATNNGSLTNYSFNASGFNSYVNANFRRDFGKWLASKLTFRTLFEQQDYRDNIEGGNTLAAPGLRTADAVTANFFVGSGATSVRQLSTFADLSLDFFDGRYLVGALIRRDGASLFGEGNRWATFGRGSLAYNVSDEKWWGVPGISSMKLRTSLGTAGGRPNFAAQYETFSIGTGGLLNRVQLGNRFLRPEVTSEWEIGTDMELLGRASFMINYAQSSTRDQILPVQVPQAAGFTTQWQNAGILDNKTWEAQLNFPVIERKSLAWTTGVVYSANVARIRSLNVPPFFGSAGRQGAESFTQFAAGERLGTIYGRKFIRSCSDLPAAFAAQCGGATAQFQANDQGYIVWTGGRSIREGITNNLWQADLPGASAPWGQRTSWGMPILLRDGNNNPALVSLGNGLPDFRLAWSNNVTVGRWSIYGLLDGAFGQEVWNQGYHWSLGDFAVRDADQETRSVETAKPLGYYWRVGPTLGGHPDGVGGFYDILGPNNETVEDASYVKLREINIGYRVGRLFGYGDFTVGVVGRNLLTWTRGYRGFDPETGLTGGAVGSAAITAIDRYNFPNLRTFTFSIATTF